MRNKIFISQETLRFVKTLPEFTLSDLSPLTIDKAYLKILLSRYAKNHKIVRLKKGLYTTREYLERIEKRGWLSSYTEFLANTLHQPSYLSLDYVLSQHELLTGLPFNFTSVSQNKTLSLSNHFGHFFYHKVKKELFTGFKAVKEGNWTLFKATKAKALFDYLYLRKNHLLDKKAVEELRLNLQNFKKNDRKEFQKYLKIEGSKKMKLISHWLFD